MFVLTAVTTVNFWKRESKGGDDILDFTLGKPFLFKIFLCLISYKQLTNAVSHQSSQKPEKEKKKSRSLRTGEIDVISLQKDPGGIAVLTHTTNYRDHLILFYLNDKSRLGAAVWTPASLANATL